MKFTIPGHALDSTPFAFLRSAGYTYIESRHTGQGSFARPLGNGHYPRFHIYVDETPQFITFNLHLDQKQASYAGVSAHSGEYDSDTVAREAARLKSLLPPARRFAAPTPADNAPSGGDERSSRWSALLRNR